MNIRDSVVLGTAIVFIIFYFNMARRVYVAEARTLLLIYWPIRDNIKMHGQGPLL